jgi:hypothetical protein
MLGFFLHLLKGPPNNGGSPRSGSPDDFSGETMGSGTELVPLCSDKKHIGTSPLRKVRKKSKT